MNIPANIIKAIVLILSLTISGVQQIATAQHLPVSDSENTGNWILNNQVSDEFDGDSIDQDKWYIVGKFENGEPVYIDPDNPNRKVWIGRAPSQFSGRNYRVENGKLMMEVRWEPDFPFSDEIEEYANGDKYSYENLTTPCFIGRRMFQYGYMEIKSKAADAEVTSSFWSTGNNAEFDFFEMFGDHRQEQKDWKDRELWWSIHDWSPGMGGASVYTEHHDLGFRVADDFHTYGIEWDQTGVKYFVDGELFTQATAEDIDAYAAEKGYDKGYVIDKPLKIWLDMETFPWHGVPDSEADLTLNGNADEKENARMDYQIEYVRVWQKADPNLLDSDFFGFESKIKINGEDKDWYINKASSVHFEINEQKPLDGSKSLKFSHRGSLDGNTVAFAPFGSVNLPVGDYTLLMDLWLSSNHGIKRIRPILESPWTAIDTLDLSKMETGKWIKAKVNFSRSTPSTTGTDKDDRLRILVKPEDIEGNGGTLFIDNISIVPNNDAKPNSTKQLEASAIKVYPNPAKNNIHVKAEKGNHINIYNLAGNLLKSTPKTNDPFSLAVNNLPPGIYLLNILGESLNKTQKIRIL